MRQATLFGRACVECGRRFQPYRPQVVCCSSDCADARLSKVRKERARALRLLTKPKPCTECGRSFVPSRRTADCCSGRCRSLRWKKENPDKYKAGYVAVGRARAGRLKKEMLAAYGSVCACPGGCGEWREEFLTLDHVGAHRDRRVAKNGQKHSGANEYLRLKNLGWPKDGLRVLCMNCNWGIRFGGKCPHENGASPLRLIGRIA